MEKTEERIYLALKLDKSSIGKDRNGDFIFDVEASNENLDLEEQKVLQRALLDSKEYFLSNGFISKDHLHQKIVGEGDNKTLIYDEDFIIGEPLEVYTKGTSTRVKGKLYKNNEYAQKFIKLLQEGSSRVKASVGGLLPIVKKVKEGGKEIEKVISVLWNDLALTISPVNPTVSSAYIVKSLNSLEFVKALTAGHGTDSSKFTGGRAIIKENIESRQKENAELDERLIYFLTKIIQGNIHTEKEAKELLSKIYKDDKWSLEEIIKTIYKNREKIEEVLPMIKWEDMFPFMKKSNTPEKKEDDDLELNSENLEGKNEGGDDEVKISKSLLENLSETVATLSTKVEEMSKAMEEGQEYMAKAINANRQSIDEILGQPKPKTSVVNSTELMTKGAFGNGQKIAHKQFTTQSKEMALDIFTKARRAGEISLMDVVKVEGQINKSIVNPSFQIDQKYIMLLQAKMREAGLV
ncbi:MAG: hypothetical protein ACTTIZ_00920 [Treponema sp.]